MPTADEVEVRLTAATDKYVADLFKADRAFATITKNMEKEAVAAGAAFTRLGTSAQVGAGQAATAFQRIEDASQNTNANVGNIAAQFQDIGVTAAAGMNPMIIALQQGTQLSAILNQSVEKGVSPVKALGAAFGQILNPISLATIALVALGAAAIQYFGTLLGDGPASEEELKKQDDVLRSIADKWGDLVPAVQAYIEARDKATETKETEEGFTDLIKRGWDDAEAASTNAGVAFGEAISVLSALGADATPEVIDLQTEFNTLADKVREGNATTADAERLNAALARVMQTTGVPAVQALAGVFNTLTTAITNANIAQAKFQQDQAAITDPGLPAKQTSEFISEQERLNGLTAEQLRQENEVNRVKAEAGRDDIILTEQQALDIANQRVKAEERRRDIAKETKTDTKAFDATEREKQAVLELIDALEFEQSLIGMTAEQKAVEIELRRAGAAATDEQRAAIEALVQATYQENLALTQAQETYDAIKDLAGDALKGFISDLREGKSAGEAFQNVLDDILDKLIQIALNAALNAIFPGLGSVAGLFGGGRASGGPVSGGRSYLVGERGPEIFTPSSAGNITANKDIGGGGATKIALVVEEGAAFSTRVREVAGPQSVAVTSGGIQTYDKALPGRSAEKDARYG